MTDRTERYEQQRWIEDDLRHSTAAVDDHDWRPDRAIYTSAEDAVGQYRSLYTKLEGMPAIDYERPIVDSSPAPQNPASLRVHEVVFLERIFERVCRQVTDYRWRCWGLIRWERAGLAVTARREELERRDEIKKLHDVDELEKWCDHYGIPYPPEEPEARESWAEGVGVDLHNVHQSCDGKPDVWELAMAAAGVSGRTVRRYRDQVDAVLEERLDDEDALISYAVRDEDEARLIEEGA